MCSFYTDTGRHVIFAYDYDIRTGHPTNRRVHINTDEDLPIMDTMTTPGLPKGRGYPDGLCLDDEGGIWSAR